MKIANHFQITKSSNYQIKKMSFEEFFKKKRIDLDALQRGVPALFSEFKDHFEQMGEKSFDHTKKYWFNKLRLEYPAAIEAKPEKVKIDNPLAEQTITESLIEGAAPAPKLGFTPKFRSASVPKPAEPAEEAKTGEQPEVPAPKLGFTPKFRSASVPKPAAEPAEQPLEESKPAEQPEATPAPKLGFKPKFKAANLPKPDAEAAEPPPVEKAADTPAPSSAEDTVPKPAYKPRFNMNTIPKKDE